MARPPPPDLPALLDAGVGLFTRGATHAGAAALNHLLAQDPAQRARLARHAGATVHVVVDLAAGVTPPALVLRIGAGGEMHPADDADGQAPAAQLRLAPSVDAGLDALRAGRAGALRHLRIEGEPALVATLDSLAATLRWDAEEELSQVIGDAAARRVGAAVERGRAQARAAAARLGVQLSALRPRDAGPVVGRAQLDAFADTLAALSERVAALEGGRKAGG